MKLLDWWRRKQQEREDEAQALDEDARPGDGAMIVGMPESASSDPLSAPLVEKIVEETRRMALGHGQV
jgi:hypothetical protein